VQGAAGRSFRAPKRSQLARRSGSTDRGAPSSGAMTAENLRTALRARSAFRLLIIAVGGNREHRRDAYDTLGSATCVALRPSEKNHLFPRERTTNFITPSPPFGTAYLSVSEIRLFSTRSDSAPATWQNLDPRLCRDTQIVRPPASLHGNKQQPSLP
jgi:hypothetical protein